MTVLDWVDAVAAGAFIVAGWVFLAVVAWALTGSRRAYRSHMTNTDPEHIDVELPAKEETTVEVQPEATGDAVQPQPVQPPTETK